MSLKNRSNIMKKVIQFKDSFIGIEKSTNFFLSQISFYPIDSNYYLLTSVDDSSVSFVVQIYKRNINMWYNDKNCHSDILNHLQEKNNFSIGFIVSIKDRKTSLLKHIPIIIDWNNYTGCQIATNCDIEELDNAPYPTLNLLRLYH